MQFDIEELSIPLDKKNALLVGDSEWSLDELSGLLETLGANPHYRVPVVLKKIHAGTYIGEGKLTEIKTLKEAHECEFVCFDFDLSPSQLKNIQKVLGGLVLDRAAIILEIFNKHARSREAKLQVELARLEYFMPRLAHLWSHFERQRGSGGGALKGKGMGEKQIEVDRRMVKDRMTMLRKKMKEVDSARDLHRKHRQSLLKVALVGYTNAGKSTLLNALTHSEVLVEDALFATLDATVRLLNPKSRPAILGIDTVGFIDRLPHGLVASFRTTLSSVLEADLLLHVLDASHPEVQRHHEVTMKVLEELGVLEKKIPMFIVFNKCDRATDLSMLKIWAAKLARELKTASDGTQVQDYAPLFISAHRTDDVDNLRNTIVRHFESDMQVLEVLIPFDDGKTQAQIYEVANVEIKRNTEKGVFFRIKTMPHLADKLNLARFKI